MTICLFAALIIGMITVPAFADIPLSLYKQLERGIPINMIECSDNKTLTSSPNGRTACVYDSTAKKLESRGWVIVLQETNKIIKLDESIGFSSNDAKTDFVSQDRIIESSDDFPMTLNTVPVLIFGHPTTVIFDYPAQMRVGEINTIRLNYTFAEIDDDTGELTKKHRLPDSFEVNIGLTFPSGIEILDDDFVIINSGVTALDTPYEYTVFKSRKLVEINPSIWQQTEIQFRVNEPVNTPKDMLHTWVHAKTAHKWLKTNNGIVSVLDERPASVIGQNNKLKINQPYQEKSIFLSGESKPITEDTLPPIIDSFAEFLREHVQPTTSNMTEYLINHDGLPQSYIDELFEKYPDLNT